MNYRRARTRSQISAIYRKLPATANSLNNLAGLYQAQSKYEQAEPLYERAIAILAKVFPQGHPHYELVKDNLNKLRTAMEHERKAK